MGAATTTTAPQLEESKGATWTLCGDSTGPTDGYHEFDVEEKFVSGLFTAVHPLVCRYCGLHLDIAFNLEGDRSEGEDLRVTVTSAVGMEV